LSSESVTAVVDLNAGGRGAKRPFPLLLDDAPLPTLRRVGVRLIGVVGSVDSSVVEDLFAAAADLDAGLRVRVVAVFRVRVVDEVDFLAEEVRLDEVDFVAALSSPFGEAASSETSGLDAAAALTRACARVIHNPVKYDLVNLMVESATRADSEDIFMSNAATSMCLPTSFTAWSAG